jgi:glycerophosphoryl diester phosphodiesterase
MSRMKARPLLLGHRGTCSPSHSVRENSLAAFDLALQHGCDGFEFDVRLTADGRAVVCHDPKFEGISLAKATAADLQALPRLEEVLARYAKRAFLDIELKVPGLESHVLSALVEHPPERGCVVSSFLPDTLIELRARSGSVPLGIICEQKRQLNRWPELPIEYVIASETLITREVLRKVHEAEKFLICWTVNKQASMVRLADWGIDGIISDKTELMVTTFKGLT